jgi:hypothetical protein
VGTGALPNSGGKSVVVAGVVNGGVSFVVEGSAEGSAGIVRLVPGGELSRGYSTGAVTVTIRVQEETIHETVVMITNPMPKKIFLDLDISATSPQLIQL